MIVSLKAGGTGLNLTAANNVIHYDLWWNPAVENQATDRVYRIGQTKTVNVYRFITQNTFEEKIDAMIKSKLELSNLTVATGENWIGELSNKELQALFAME
jgi:SNF2 family DNA or RNA helicase